MKSLTIVYIKFDVNLPLNFYSVNKFCMRKYMFDKRKNYIIAIGCRIE